MISLFSVTIGVLWFISAFFDYNQFTYIWQLKEYRRDRFRDFLSTRKGKQFFLQWPLLWRSGIALGMFFWPINDPGVVRDALLLLLSIDLLYHGIRTLRQRAITHPKFTKKALLIIAGAMIFEGGVFLLLRDWTILFLLMIVRFPITSGIVALLKIPSQALKEYYIRKATKKLRQFPNLRIIGITGSFGKTSVKVFLYQILSKKYRVVYAPKNINTEIGVAQFILKQNFSDADIFIVEMGAYKMGEIQKIAEMTRPSIGILTAINEQHLSLFGSIEHIQQTKYELLRALPKNGLAVVNSDNPYCREFLHELEASVQTFGIEEEWHPNLQIIGIKETAKGLRCKAKYKGGIIEWSTRIIGAHNAMNLAPCILVTSFLGMTMGEITAAMQPLLAPKGSLELFQYGNSIIIDDSHNSNPNGFKAALHTMATFPSKRRRIVVTRGMIELGNKSDELHERIAEEIAFTADELILISRDFEEPLRRGSNQRYPLQINVMEDLGALKTYLRSWKDKEAVILIENRVPDAIRQEWISTPYS